MLTTASSDQRIHFKNNPVLKTGSFLFLCIWLWTLIDVNDMVNWTLENIPVFLFVLILISTYKKIKLSDLSYILIFAYLSLHIYGAKFTYAENPFGFWLQEKFETERNHYDRIVHFLFGIMMSYPIREICITYFKFSYRVSLGMPIIVCLSLGALYEIVEGTIVGIFFPEQGANFLGIQGDIWDPQKDIALAWIGSICSIAVLSLVKSLRLKFLLSHGTTKGIPGEKFRIVR